jgi:DNA mismatch repair protein MutL
MAIHLLPPEVASQIAAGEVVERPASVVKELLENSLDAGATRISISVEGAGQRLIEVSDDGRGIPSGELSLAVARHATSKLQVAEDLFNIATLGFRGEALASIASVARLTLTSRPADQAAAMRLRIDGGISTHPEQVGAPVGTVVRVEDLFYNVPARLKFLKHENTERRQIDATVTQYALAYPQVRIDLRQEGRAALQTSGNGNRREVLASLYGVDSARQMIEVISGEDGLNVTGFVSPTHLTRSNRREITFFVNGRPVQDAALTSAVLQAYHTLLMVGRFPMAVLFLELSPAEVDVNVHPAKAEVRFRDASRAFTGVQHAVRRALLSHTAVPALEAPLPRWTPPGPDQDDQQVPAGQQSGQAWDFPAPARPSLAQSSGMERSMAAYLPPEPSSPATSMPAQSSQPGGLRAPLLRLVGQVASTYLVAEGPDGLYLIDQHAAHERILFERLMAQHGAAARQAVQTLLSPVAVELPPASARMLADQLPMLAHLGFQVEPFGPGAFLVRALPALLAHMDPSAALKVIVEDFEEDETPLRAEIEARLAARVCKRAAVKGGQVLSAQEQSALLSDLQACASPRTCPHGRPTMIHLPVDLLERQFGRKGAR